MSQTTVTPPETSTMPRPSTGSPQKPNISSGRESVESFVLVFMFFLVLGLEAEGFVIPTGSMAPTLMGRHKEITCPQCGLIYQVNADREISDAPAGLSGSRWIEAGTCVNCRFQAKIGDEPNFQGDRIYVMKTPLSFPFLESVWPVQLNRWDVAVFKLPEEPEVRYIKRLIGMPDEIVRILRGDIWIKSREKGGQFQRAPRPLKHQDGMQILVHDDSCNATALASDPRWKRWVSRTPDAWQETAGPKKTYRTSGSDNAFSELRYRHVLPDPRQWEAILAGRKLPHPPRATLITDFYSYNTDLTADTPAYPMSSAKAWRQPHWVGDLTLALKLEVTERKGIVRFELIKGGVANRCEIDLATGLATLAHGETLLSVPKPSGIDRPGSYAIRFANVDDRLTLSVDGRLPFGEGIDFEATLDEIAPTAFDLDPVGIAAKGSALAVSELVLSRDIYYTIDPARVDYEELDLGVPFPTDPVSMFDWLADPSRFKVFNQLQHHDYPIAPKHYMMLGDNSPWSRDGRAWKSTDQRRGDDPNQGWDSSGRESWEVPESLLIGKAFCVYWPHLKPTSPSFRVGRDVRLPARPYVEKMRWIR